MEIRSVVAWGELGEEWLQGGVKEFWGMKETVDCICKFCILYSDGGGGYT